MERVREEPALQLWEYDVYCFWCQKTLDYFTQFFSLCRLLLLPKPVDTLQKTKMGEKYRSPSFCRQKTLPPSQGTHDPPSVSPSLSHTPSFYQTPKSFFWCERAHQNWRRQKTQPWIKRQGQGVRSIARFELRRVLVRKWRSEQRGPMQPVVQPSRTKLDWVLLCFCACSVLRHCGADSSWPALSEALLCLMPGGGEVWGRIKSAGVGHSLWTFTFIEDISIHAQKKATDSQSTSLASCRKIWQGLILRKSFGGFRRQWSCPLRQGTGFWIKVRNISLEVKVNGTRFSVVVFFI